MGKVFIASSQEGQEYAEIVARVVHAEGHQPLLWWSPTSFPLNRTLIESVAALGGVADGALIVATPDDLTTRRGRETYSPTGNILLEYGFFSGTLGRDRTAIIRVANATLPSDLSGVVYLQLPPLGGSDTAVYQAVHAREPLATWLQDLDTTSNDARKIAHALNKLGPFSSSTARMQLKAQMLSAHITSRAFVRLPRAAVSELFERYGRLLPGGDEVGYHDKTIVNSFLNLADVPKGSDDERALASHFAGYVAGLLNEGLVTAPTLVAMSKLGKTSVVEMAASMLPFPVVEVSPDAPSRDRRIEGYFEPGDRVCFLHDVVLSGHHLVDCIACLRARGVAADDLVALARHEADTQGLMPLMSANGVTLHFAETYRPERSNSDQVTPASESRRCLLCDVLEGVADVPFRRLFNEAEARSEILLETATCAVVADVAPLTEGHVLIVAKSHVPSLASMSDGERRDVEAVRQEVSRILQRATGIQCVAFEHGLCDPAIRSSCGIDHAHLHVLPLGVDLMVALASKWSWTHVAGLEDVPPATSVAGEYLLYIDQKGVCSYAELTEASSQVFRRTVAEQLGKPIWSWSDQTLLGDRMADRAAVARVREMLGSDVERA